MRHFIWFLCCCALFIPATVSADTVALGVLSFDNPIPDGTTPGVNVFDITNYTGAFDLPPDLPVATGVTFQNAVLTVDIDGGGSEQIDLGDIGPGVYSPSADDEFTDTINFTDATLTATLDVTSLQLDDGSTFTADPDILVTILPSSPPDLIAGTDFAIITASSAEAPSTPEPGTAALLSVSGGGLLFMLARKKRFQFCKVGSRATWRRAL